MSQTVPPNNFPLPPEVRRTLQQAAHEIAQLRHQQTIMSAKIEVMDIFALALRGVQPSLAAGFRECLVSRIEQQLRTDDELRNKFGQPL